MSMTAHQVIDLLGQAAAYDQRTLGEFDVIAWQQSAELAGWTVPEATRALVEHYTFGGDRPGRATPADITRVIAGKRREIRARVRQQLPAPPAELAQEGAALVEWTRRTAAELERAQVAAWAAEITAPRLRAVGDGR